MPDIVLELDGKEVTLPVDTIRDHLPDGYNLLSSKEVEASFVPRKSVDENYVLKASFDERFRNWTPLDKAHENESVVAKVLAGHPVDAPDIDEMRETLRKAEVEPLKQKYGSLKQSLRDSEILAQAKTYFDEVFTVTPPAGGKTWAENALASRYEYSDEYGYVVTIQNGQPVPSANPTNARPYRSVAEDMAALVDDPAWKPFAKKPAKGGGGDGRPGEGDARDTSNNGKLESTEDILAAYRKDPQGVLSKL